MARKIAAADPADDDLVPVKIRRSSLRMARTLASWRDISIADFIEELVLAAAATQVPDVAAQMAKAAKKKPE